MYGFLLLLTFLNFFEFVFFEFKPKLNIGRFKETNHKTHRRQTLNS